MSVVSINKIKLLKQLHNMCLRKLPSQHGKVSVKRIQCGANWSVSFAGTKGSLSCGLLELNRNSNPV